MIRSTRVKYGMVYKYDFTVSILKIRSKLVKYWMVYHYEFAVSILKIRSKRVKYWMVYQYESVISIPKIQSMVPSFLILSMQIRVIVSLVLTVWTWYRWRRWWRWQGNGGTSYNSNPHRMSRPSPQVVLYLYSTMTLSSVWQRSVR